MVKIFIDPGHGGSDPGAVGNGLQEKNLTLSIATRVREIITSEYENVSIQMSRTGDQTVSLISRTNAANRWGADFYLSIHINSGGGTGFETYRYPGSGRSTSTYQQKIHESIMAEINLRDRGAKQANFHVLRETTMPSVLTENGFIDNRNDAALLRNLNFIESLARGHANGVASALNLRRKQVNVSPNLPSPSTPTGPSTNGLFRVQIGAFRNRENAEQTATAAKARGFQTYVKEEDNLFKVQIGAFSNRENAEALVRRAEEAGFDAAIIID
ncbi:N-acetylmuramoyl-L-alanine amidase [Niallia sp. Krafla_26]|uniref:N-acetylmuramoyl-L-alanine amidase n=1 Tax=Niallia sp. Krafla_26 TaxID=3064703 RepID=UPI003D1693F5